MTTVAKAVQVVKPHIPLIRFPDRASVSKLGLQATTLPPSAPTLAASSPVTSQSIPSTQPTYQKPVGYTPRGSGAEWHTLPERYQRRPISQEEMEYIERGGPE